MATRLVEVEVIDDPDISVRVCTICGKRRLETDFGKHGNQGRRKHCKFCSADYRRNREAMLKAGTWVPTRKSRLPIQTKEERLAYQRTWYQQNTEHCRERGREYRKRNRERMLTYERAWRAKNQERLREQGRARRRGPKQEQIRKYFREHKRQRAVEDVCRQHKISVTDFERMMTQQGRVCAVCGQPNRDGHRLALDHDHATGHVRGLLCDKHNLMLGQMGDDPILFEKMAAYLRSHAAGNPGAI